MLSNLSHRLRHASLSQWRSATGGLLAATGPYRCVETRAGESQEPVRRSVRDSSRPAPPPSHDVFKLTNLPWAATPEDVIAFLRPGIPEAALRAPEALQPIYLAHGEVDFWRVSIPENRMVKPFLEYVANTTWVDRRVGFFRISPEDDTKLLTSKTYMLFQGFRGTSLLMAHLDENVPMDSLEAFFEPYMVHAQAVRFLKVGPTNKDQTQRTFVGKFGERALVRFQSSWEAHRALRERRRDFLETYPVDLRFLY